MDYFEAALLRFPSDALLRVHYAVFLIHYAKRTNLAYGHLRVVLQQDVVAIDAWYLAHRVSKQLLGRCANTRDAEAKEMLQKIHKHHRACLASIVSLWSMLMSDNFEISALDQLTTSISNQAHQVVPSVPASIPCAGLTLPPLNAACFASSSPFTQSRSRCFFVGGDGVSD